MSTNEAATALGVSPARVRQLLAEGGLDGVKAGRDWLVSRASVGLWRSRQRRSA
jgi:excisionase family DNA binding protein